MTLQLTVSRHGRLAWFKHCHLVEVGVGSVLGSSGGYPSNRVGQCHENISGGEKTGVGTASH